jgi:hypothetical protein
MLPSEAGRGESLKMVADGASIFEVPVNPTHKKLDDWHDGVDDRHPESRQSSMKLTLPSSII